LGFASRAWPTCPKPWLHKRNTTPPSPRVGSRSKPDGSHASRCRCVREGHARSSFAWCENSDALLYSPPPLGATHAAYAGGIGAKTHTRFGENSRAVRALTEDRPRVSVSSSWWREQKSVLTPQAARGWYHPPCGHFKSQSCCCLGSAFEVAAFQTPVLEGVCC
jgi:hypothetical protein